VVSLTAIQDCEQDDTYAWDKLEHHDGLPVQTLFRDGDAATHPVHEMGQRLARVMIEAGPQVVVVPGWSSRLALVALTWCLRTHTPAVVMSESTAWDEKRVAWKERIKRRVLGLFSAALAGGTPQRDYLVQLGLPKESVFLGYDAVDNEYFGRKCEEIRGRGPDLRHQNRLPERYFLASARFVEKKNLSRLLQGYARYREQNIERPWHLVLLGDGPLNRDIRSLISDFSLQDCVHLPGFKQYIELPIYYGLAGAFIHASTTEQWGLVVNEAMASGLPVLVSNRCGCAADLIHDGLNGFTFDPFAVDQIASSMRRIALMDDETRAKMGTESQRLIAHWGPKRFADGLASAARAAITAPAPRVNFFTGLLLRLLLLR